MHPDETAAPLPAADVSGATTTPPEVAQAAAGEGAAAGQTPAEPGLPPAECSVRLAALFPALFVAPGAPGPFKPIKLRIHADILARAPGVFSKRALGVFFSRYTTSNAYLKALAAPGAQRFDLDGQPAGAPAEEHRAAAVEELARRHAIAAERRAAQRKAMAPEPAVPAEGPRPPPRPPRERDAARGEARERRPPRPRHDPRPGSEQHARPQRPARRDPPRRAPAPVPPALTADPAQRERAQLLYAFESSPLSKSNFCVLKRMSEAELDALLNQARAERA
jgi:sRNA-binding protein